MIGLAVNFDVAKLRRRCDGNSESVKRAAGIAMNLVAGALLLFGNSVAVAQAANSYYAATVSSLTSGSGITVTAPAVVTLGGYYNVGDGGGGTFVSGSTLTNPCTAANGGTIIPDKGNNCLYRANPTNSVREWGARCDVVAIQTKTGATWNPSLSDPHTGVSHPALVVATSLLTTPPASNGGAYGQYIAISQVGGPTLWVPSSGTATAAVSATRFSALGGTQVNYKPGDLISFLGAVGNFSQQIAIIVDSVNTGGAINKWHYLWGGLYDPATPTTALTQDRAHSFCANVCGTGTGQANGAIFTPAWSGWSLLNNQTIGSHGSGYAVGDTITLGGLASSPGTVNGTQSPTLVVETLVPGTTSVESFDWLNYGSYSALPGDPTQLKQTGHTGGGTGFTLTNVLWTHGPLTTKIIDVYVDTASGNTDIFLADGGPQSPLYPLTSPPLAIQYFYYGDDDQSYINNALTSQSTTSIIAGNGGAFTLPAGCGTTKPILLPQDTTANFVNPSLNGSNFQSTGLYAFANPLANRSVSGPGNTPVLNRVLYGGLKPTYGGGFRDMLIEAMGIPEGFGYYGLAQGVAPPGGTSYVGPPTTSPAYYTTPSAGDAVEIDSGKYLRIDNVHVSDGGIGPGNSVFHCGIDESDPPNPTPFFGTNAIGNIVLTDSRFDGNSNFSGATNPDFSMRLGNSCHDSVYRAVSAYDGTTADVLEYNGNLFSQIHVNSDAANSNTGNADPLLTFVPGINTGFAGVANYGVYVLGNTSLSQTQCDIANIACVFVSSLSGASLYNPGQITDTQMKCGSLQSVPPNYFGVELGTGVVNTTVSGTAASGKCNVPPGQLVVLDGLTPPASVDPSVSVCNNTNALVIFCAGYQNGFASGRAYTQPALAYSTVALAGAHSPSTTTLYAIPFISPTGGPISQMGVYVASNSGSGGASKCHLGIYSTLNGVPGNLLLDAQWANIPSVIPNPMTIGGLNFFVQPNTLYFLAVACDGTLTVEAASASNGLAGHFVGEKDFTTYGGTNMIATSWVFAANHFPSPFPALTTPYGSNTTVPNIYLTP